MSQRLSQINSQISGSLSSTKTLKSQTDDDVVIVAAYRTAIAKGGKGSFKDTTSDTLLYKFLVEFFKKTGVDPKIIEDVACGNVLNLGAGATEHRAACLAAGIPYETSFVAVNRQCSSGLTTVNDIANKIKAGQIEIGLALGVESMSSNYGAKAVPSLSDEVKNNKEGKKCTIPMGITNENIAEQYGIPRSVQDEFAANSYKKAEAAVSSGLFRDEILPIEVTIEGEDDEKITKVVKDDEGPRKGVTAESLGKIRAAFKKNGTTHAGNASQVSDGAAGVLLAKRSVAKKLGLTIIGKYVAFASVGVPPEIMGVGPAYAIPRALELAGVSIQDIDVFEINEAFAAQAYFSIKKLNIDMSKVNPRGGAIALGHPLGCTGARQVATILRELQPGQAGVCSMCIGTGMGAAAIFVKE